MNVQILLSAENEDEVYGFYVMYFLKESFWNFDRYPYFQKVICNRKWCKDKRSSVNSYKY